MNILIKFTAHDNIKINGEVEKNFSENLSIEFVVEIKTYIYIYVFKYKFFCMTFITKNTKIMLNPFLTQFVATIKGTVRPKTDEI